MAVKAFLYLLFVAFITHVAALDWTGAKWIWDTPSNNGNQPPGTRDFRREYFTPSGKKVVSAEVLITADNAYSLFVNGNLIGSGNDWRTSQEYCVRLDPFCNVFAVRATNAGATPNPAGVLAAIQITYTDGFTETIVSDTNWRAHTDTVGFEQVSFDDSSWQRAVVQKNAGDAPYGNIPLPAAPPPLTLNGANWIWTNEVDSAGNAPIGNRAFRKTIAIPNGLRATSGTIIISADNGYTLYVNGKMIGSGGDWRVAQRWVFDLPSLDDVEIAVFATNTGGPAGIIAAVRLDTTDCNCSSTISFVTDGSWKANTGTPTGFEQPGFDDSTWPGATVEGPYGRAPWGPIPTQNGVAKFTEKIQGAPDAEMGKVVVP
ncbi:carbohydrate-binding module family 67 protein [Amanita thiersii Skay4041]|uniref:Carbohydrate-binding module family 67 protein n=1 Tax=Amanita thiersii Skay4041 TaxID=703135 RepID=A0A2A9NBC9_9AGAR|nr:carbohydrate-binding module family 67 protein [Amanita thiersii Skay4041]